MHLQLPSSSRVSSLFPTTPEATSAGAELVTSDGRSLALVSARLVGEARGGIARLVLEQRFVNSYDDNLRVTYRMPLPADGAVSGYAFTIGERTIRGVVDRKAAARTRFERAVASGHTAALLEQERADIFTQQIGNLPAREVLVAQITIDQRLAWLPEGEWELRFPTVIGPRYIGSADTAADVLATHIKVTDRPLTASIQIELAIQDAIVGGARPSSPTHRLDKRADGIIELTSGAQLDRDIVVRWPVATPAVGMSLDVARPETGTEAYGLVSIVPPAARAGAIAVPRDLIVLLDTSGSMDGGPLDKAKQVVAMMIDSLDEHDRLELIEFSSEPSRYLQEPVQATARAKQDAIRWVRSRTAGGGTEMRAAVVEALVTLRVGAQRQVVVVTDGYVGGEQQILDALHHRLPRSCRLHVLGVGSSVNRSLATALARAGRGAEVLVGIDEDAERGAKRLLDRTRAPMLTNVEIAGSALIRHAPAQVPDVFAGAPLVAALAVSPEGGELVVRGQLATESWEQRLVVPPIAAGAGNQAIVALFGRERVADVEARAMLDDARETDHEIEQLGLTFQISTRMTSWVAVDETRRVTGPTRDQLIPQELPYGTKASAFGLRQTTARTGARTQAGAISSTLMLSARDLGTFHDLEEAPVDHKQAVTGRFDSLDAVDGAVDGDSDESVAIPEPLEDPGFVTGKVVSSRAVDERAAPPQAEIAAPRSGPRPPGAPQQARAEQRRRAPETAKAPAAPDAPKVAPPGGVPQMLAAPVAHSVPAAKPATTAGAPSEPEPLGPGSVSPGPAVVGPRLANELRDAIIPAEARPAQKRARWRWLALALAVIAALVALWWWLT